MSNRSEDHIQTDDFEVEIIDGKEGKVFRPKLDNLLSYNKGCRVKGLMSDLYNPPTKSKNPEIITKVVKIREILRANKKLFKTPTLDKAFKTCYASWLACGMRACRGILPNGDEHLLFLEFNPDVLSLLTVFSYPGCEPNGYHHFYDLGDLKKFKTFKKLTKRHFDLDDKR